VTAYLRLTIQKPAPEIGAIGLICLYSTRDYVASFSCRWRQKGRALARETGARIWRRSYGANFWSRFLWSVCLGP